VLVGSPRRAGHRLTPAQDGIDAPAHDFGKANGASIVRKRVTDLVESPRAIG
jgi:hypothetical protein